MYAHSHVHTTLLAELEKVIIYLPLLLELADKRAIAYITSTLKKKRFKLILHNHDYPLKGYSNPLSI